MSIYKSKSKKNATTHTSLAASTLNKSTVMNSLTLVPHQLNVEVGFPRLASIFLVLFQLPRFNYLEV